MSAVALHPARGERFGERRAQEQSRATAVDVAESAIVVALMVLTSAALLGPLANPQQLLDRPEWIRLAWPPAYAVILCLIVYRWRQMARVWAAAIPSLIIAVYALTSVVWSVMPDLTSRRSVALGFVTLFGVYLAGAFSWRRLIGLLAVTLCVLAICSAVLALAVPSIGVHTGAHAGAWKGAWFEKNAMGAWMAVGVVACLSSCLFDPQRRGWWLAGAGLCAVLLKMSTSATALVMLFLVLCAFGAVAAIRRGPAAAVVVLWGAAAVLFGLGALFLIAADAVFSVIGRDMTLTGRTEIWAALIRRWQEEPWLGYGYNGFWLSSDAAQIVRHELNWDVRNADGAWFQVLVELGAVGVAMAAAHMILTWGAAIRSLLGCQHVYWCVPFLVVLCGYSVTESNLMRPNDLMWAIYVATSIKLLLREAPSA